MNDAALAKAATDSGRLGPNTIHMWITPACSIRSNLTPDPRARCAWCRAEFANFKVPHYVQLVDAFPLNATGKILKHELRERARAETQARECPPTSRCW